MCGIAGVWSNGKPDEVRAAVRAVMAASRHRGPDAGAWVDVCQPLSKGRPKDGAPNDCLVLGHTRLSILDLSEGAGQPMHHTASDSWLVYNGEIYNFRQLRGELEKLGAAFTTTGDSEVLLQALVHWGEAALERLEGMFAFAFWDGRARHLLLARDGLGIKPLYYFAGVHSFGFASEVKALERASLGQLTLDRDGMESFLALGAVIGPGTIYREIRELEPGHVLRVGAPGEIADREYWSLAGELTRRGAAPEQSFDEAVSEVRERLTDAVAAHLVSDVPVGVFLSGGVDSSLLALVASQRAAQPVTLLTVAFAEQEFSELPYAQQIARQLPHHHEVVTLSGERLREMLPEALAAMDQPTVDGINTYVIARVGAALGLKVLLSGIGGDELFGGYTTFVKVPRLLRFHAGLGPAARVLSRLKTKNPIPWKKVADAGRLNSLAEAYLLQRSIRWTPEVLDSLASRFESGAGGLANNFQKLAALEIAVYLRNQLLRDADVFSMASSVELRVPFLDRRLLRAALNLAPQHHFESGRGKRITQRLLQELSQQPFTRRRKMGFTFPWQPWLQSSLKKTIADTLRDERPYEALAIDPAYGRQLLQGLERGERTQSWSQVWSLFVLLNWQTRSGVECAVA
ncbi:MAG TPA: asparagine synthase (glutamine-hydrolyzing) [Bryocella sp.]|nr:asparagine synthase (glutamine-hydrolyzing) [Bryocella sp.]